MIRRDLKEGQRIIERLRGPEVIKEWEDQRGVW